MKGVGGPSPTQIFEILFKQIIPTQRAFKLVTTPFEFCVITFEPVSAPQNDRLNLSFVIYIYVEGGKLARNVLKTTSYIS